MKPREALTWELGIVTKINQSMKYSQTFVEHNHEIIAKQCQNYENHYK